MTRRAGRWINALPVGNRGPEENIPPFANRAGVRLVHWTAAPMFLQLNASCSLQITPKCHFDNVEAKRLLFIKPYQEQIRAFL